MNGPKIAITLIFMAMFAMFLVTYYKATTPNSKIVEVRTRHLVWESPGCKVYQVRIKNEWGVKTIFITTADPSKTGNRTAVYPTCRVTH